MGMDWGRYLERYLLGFYLLGFFGSCVSKLRRVSDNRGGIQTTKVKKTSNIVLVMASISTDELPNDVSLQRNQNRDEQTLGTQKVSCPNLEQCASAVHQALMTTLKYSRNYEYREHVLLRLQAKDSTEASRSFGKSLSQVIKAVHHQDVSLDNFGDK